MSDQHYAAPGRPGDPATTYIAAPPTQTMATQAVAGAPGSRVGFVPARTNRVRDGLAVALLAAAPLLPWSVEFGLGVPGSNLPLFLAVAGVTLLALLAALAPHVGPLSLTAPKPNLARTVRMRCWLSMPYLLCALGFVGYHLLETWRDGGTGQVPPGSGPGMWLGVAGALLAAQPPITSTTVEDNDFRRWYASARALGVASILLAVLSVGFNLFWRLRYLWVTDVAVAGQDVAVIVNAVLYGAVAMIALIIGSVWLTQRTAAARLATTALGVSAGLAGTLVWLAAIGRDVDAFHGIAQNTSTAAVGYEGYLFWAAAAAIVAPTTLYAVFKIKPPTLAVYRVAALKCLTLIAFWSLAAAALRVTDYAVALSLDLPRRSYDSFALTAFNLVTACVALWLRRRLNKGGLTSAVIAAFSGLLSVFTAAQLVIGVALAPRYADPVPRSPDAIYGNDLAHQITSTFDVVVCFLSLAILVAALVTGPLAGYLVRRREPEPAPTVAVAAPASAAPPAPVAAAPTVSIATPPQPRPQPTVPKIARLKEDATTIISMPQPVAPEMSDATAALRIQRRPQAGDAAATTHIPKPDHGAS